MLIVNQKLEKIQVSIVLIVFSFLQMFFEGNSKFIIQIILVIGVTSFVYLSDNSLKNNFIILTWIIYDILFFVINITKDKALSTNIFYLFILKYYIKLNNKNFRSVCLYLKYYHFFIKIILMLFIQPFQHSYKYFPEMMFQLLFINMCLNRNIQSTCHRKLKPTQPNFFSLKEIPRIYESDTDKLNSEILENYQNGIIVFEFNQENTENSKKEYIDEFNICFYNKVSKKLLGFENRSTIQKSMSDFRVFESDHYVSLSLNSTQISKNNSSLLNDILKNRTNHNFCQKYISEEKKMLLVQIHDFLIPNTRKNYRIVSIDSMEDEREKIFVLLFGGLKSKLFLTICHEVNNPLNGLFHKANELIQTQSNRVRAESGEKIKFFVFMIKIFLRNLSLFLKFIYKEKFHNELVYMNFFHHFNKIHQKFIMIFDEKDIKFLFSKELPGIRNLIIFNDCTHFKYLIQNIYMYIYYRLKRGSEIHIEFKIDEVSNKITINLIKYKHSRLSLISHDNFNLNDSFDKDLTSSVQTLEMLREIIENLATLMKAKVIINEKINEMKMYSQNNLISIEMDFSHFEEADDSDLLIELTPQYSNDKSKNLGQMSRDVKKFNRNEQFRFKSQINKGSNFMNITVNNKPKRISLMNNPIENHLQSPSIIKKNTDFNIQSFDRFKIEDVDEDASNNSNSLIFSKNVHMKISNSSITDVNNINCLLKRSDNKVTSYLETISENNSASNSQKEQEQVKGSLKRVMKEKLENKGYVEFRLNENSKNEIKIEEDNNSSSKDSGEVELNNLPLNTCFDFDKDESFIESRRKILHSKYFSSKNLRLIYQKIDLVSGKVSINNKENNTKAQISNARRSLNSPERIQRSSLGNFCNRCKDFLIVDDENFNISTIKYILNQLNIDSDSCNDGKDCLDKIQNYIIKSCCDVSFKVILMDLMMPIMGGYETCLKIEKLISLNILKNPPKIFIISAHNQNDIIERLLNFEFVVEFIPKPIKKKKLEEIIMKYYR